MKDLYANKMSGLPHVTLWEAGATCFTPLPLAFDALPAGFPSPALDFDECRIDLNKELIPHPATTFFGRVRGDSMRDAGIGDGDLIVIDKMLDPVPGRVAVCIIDGAFTLKRLGQQGGRPVLHPANPQYSPIHVREDQEFRVWGIVTHSIKAH